MLSSEVLVCEATSNDIPDMALIIEQATALRNNEPIPQNLTKKEYLTRLEKLMLSDQTWVRLAKTKGKTIGFIIGHPTLDDTGKVIALSESLKYVMIAPDYWGNGVATKLITWSIKHMAAIGKDYLELWTLVDNLRARSLYERLGFVEGEQSMRHKKLGKESIHYKLTI